jgi:hypothetical protein
MKKFISLATFLLIAGTICRGQEAFKKPELSAQDAPPTTSLVYPGDDGRLVYIADSLGNRIPEYSNAGLAL